MIYQVADIKIIESVQATFTRLVCRKLNIKCNSYKHCLSFLKLYTLETRQTNPDLILVFKIIHKLADFKFDVFSNSPSVNLYKLRRHALHL